MKSFSLAGVCERPVQRACRVASEQHGEDLQVPDEAWPAVESSLPQHFPSLGPLRLSCSYCCLLR